MDQMVDVRLKDNSSFDDGLMIKFSKKSYLLPPGAGFIAALRRVRERHFSVGKPDVRNHS